MKFGEGFQSLTLFLWQHVNLSTKEDQIKLNRYYIQYIYIHVNIFKIYQHSSNTDFSIYIQIQQITKFVEGRPKLSDF